jgi:type VI secretion system protein
MPLTLKIVSRQRHILGADSLRVISVHGASIGRAPDNDWVLPDPDRYISGHHASIDYRAGAYYLRDNSTNGVYVNRSDQPVGRGAPLRLYDGDELRMGDYIFEVSIVNVSRDGVDDSGEDAVARPRPGNGSTANGGGISSLSLKLLGDEADEMGHAALALAEPPAIPQDDSFAATVRFPDDGIETQLHIEVPPAPVPERKPPPELQLAGTPGLKAYEEAARNKPFSPDVRRDFTEAVRLMMECAGLDSTQLPRGREEEFVAMAGRMIRATVEGLQSVLRTRALLKSQFRLSQTTMKAAGNNPLKFLPTTQEALEQLFYESPEGYLGPVEALEDAFEDLRAHQGAMVKAMQVAFRDLLDRLDPETLEERFGRTVKRGGLLSSSPKAKYWEMYAEAYQSVAGFSDENFTSIVGAKFADAYDREIHQILGRRTRVEEPPKEES